MTRQKPVIPWDQGSQEGWQIMQDRVDAMSNEMLTGIWEVLSYYDPTEYYDQEHGIGMDGYAFTIERKLRERGLPVPY